MSGTYWLQSRIASGSQAARCCGVHCCALAGKDAHVSARPRSARAVIGRRFNAARIPSANYLEQLGKELKNSVDQTISIGLIGRWKEGPVRNSVSATE